MQQSPWEANSHLASQAIPRTFMEPEGLLCCSQEPATGHYPQPDASSAHLPTLFP